MTPYAIHKPIRNNPVPLWYTLPVGVIGAVNMVLSLLAGEPVAFLFSAALLVYAVVNTENH